MTRFAVRRAGVVAALLTTAAAWTPADAAIFTATYQGTVLSGTLNVAAFGLAAGSNVVGLNYTTVVKIDDGFEPSHYYLNAQGSGASGGSFNSDGHSPVSAVFTLNGVSVSFAGGFSSLFYKDACAVANCSAGRVGGQILDQINNMETFVNLNPYYSTLLTNPDFRDTGAFPRNTGFDIGSNENPDTVGSSTNLGSSSVTRYSFALRASSLVVASATAVPEPTSWALMIGGFASIGGIMRVRARDRLAAT